MKKFILLCLFPLILFACKKEQVNNACDPDSQTADIQAPPDLDDGWSVNSLTRAGINSGYVQDMIDEIESWPEHRFEAILIVKKGELVFDLFRVNDPIQFILNLPMEYTPGTHFHYNSGGTNILGDIVHNASGITLREFARQNLFTRLGITDWEWKAIRDDDLFASGGLYMRPRDLARIGQLVLNRGVWNGKRIVSKNWIDQSIRSRIVPTEFGLGTGYGYQWWLNEFHFGEQSHSVVFSAGWGEQMMYIFPEDKTLVLFFGSYYFNGPQQSVNSLVENYLVKSFDCREAGVRDEY